MAVRKEELKWLTQPQQPRVVDWSSPFTRGLTQLVDMSSGVPRQLVGTGLVASGTIGRVARTKGLAATNNGEIVAAGTAANFLTLPVTTSEVTVLYVGGRLSTPAASRVAVAACTRSASESAGFELDFGNAFADANLLYFAPNGAGSSGAKLFVDGAQPVGVSPTDKSITNGVSYAVVASFTSHTVGSGHTVLAKAAGASDYAYDVFCSLYAVWNRQLTDTEHAELSANPWLLFEPQDIWVPVSAGGGAYSLTAESGSYALTGQSAGLLASRALAAEQGSYALTGQGVALNRGYVVAAEQGSYALTGQDAGLLRGLLLTAAQGSYALSGQDVTLTYTPLGAYSLTADQGSYDLTGQSVSLLWGRALVAEQGSYALNGQDASLVYTPAGAYSLAAGQGTYALTGQDVALLWSKVLAAAQGSYTITGQDATLSRGIVLTAAQGSYTLTGQDAAFARAYALSAGYGSYALTGQIVSLTYSGAALEALEYLLLISHITQSMSKTSKVTMEVDLISRIQQQLDGSSSI